MIKKSAGMEKEIRERMRDGKGSVEIFHIFRKEELKGRVRLFARLRLRKGCSIGFHPHDGEEEIFYILAGQGVVTDNDVVSRVGPGDAVLTGGGGGHAIENQGDEPLELIAAILPY
jgi:mannose-6-phosphate isomerase-like protein (cupin superfamily)